MTRIRIKQVAVTPEVAAEIEAMDTALFDPKHNTSEPTSRGLWWLAYQGGRVVGYAGALVWDPDRCLYLTRAGVMPEARGQGIQRRLIRARVEQARKLGLAGAYTYTAGWNVISANNLISCGFRLWCPARPWAAKSALYWWRGLT